MQEISPTAERAVCNSYIRPAMLYGSVAWCLKERDENFSRTERSTVRAMCGVQLKDRKGSTDLMFMLGFSETIDQFAMQTVFVGMAMCLVERLVMF